MIEWCVLALIYGSARQYCYEFNGYRKTKAQWVEYNMHSQLCCDHLDEEAFFKYMDHSTYGWQGAWHMESYSD